MNKFECGSLVPGCTWHVRAEEEAEVIRRAVAHLRTTHGENIIRENMIIHIKQRVKKEWGNS